MEQDMRTQPDAEGVQLAIGAMVGERNEDWIGLFVFDGWTRRRGAILVREGGTGRNRNWVDSGGRWVQGAMLGATKMLQGRSETVKFSTV